MPVSKYSKLQGARVLLLGGTSGIGFAIAEACVEAGADIIISSSTSDRLSSALSRLKHSYPEAAGANRIDGHLCDLSQAESLEMNITELLGFATKSEQKLDHITYTAANVPRLPVLPEYQVSAINEPTFILRYEAPIIISKLAKAYMKPGPRSSITFTSASTASKPVPGRGILTALGASTEGLVRGFAVDLAPIRINAVAPGTVDTELLAQLAGPDPKVQAAFKEMVKRATLLNTVAVPEDVAEAYIYLMKDANITGSIIHSDGGRLLK